MMVGEFAVFCAMISSFAAILSTYVGLSRSLALIISVVIFLVSVNLGGFKGKWREAWRILNATNDFPEFTGRICPALCEKSCVLKLSMDEPVTIREDECSIAERAFREGYIQPAQIERNGKRVAVIGSGPAGLAAANQLNHRGYEVTVFEKDEYVGGLLRFGIPNFKLQKTVIDRRTNS